jgi:hypothetical protein
MTIYTVTLRATSQHDAEKRADLNGFLKTMKRAFGLRCIGIEEKEDVETAPARRAQLLKPNLTENKAK